MVYCRVEVVIVMGDTDYSIDSDGRHCGSVLVLARLINLTAAVVRRLSLGVKYINMRQIQRELS